MAQWRTHRLTRDHVIWEFGPDLDPVHEVNPGDVVTLETNDSQIQSEDDLVTDSDTERINSAKARNRARRHAG